MIDPDLMVQIRQRAYEIWQREGCPQGRDRIHWLRAEAEFREKLQSARVVLAKAKARYPRGSGGNPPVVAGLPRPAEKATLGRGGL